MKDVSNGSKWYHKLLGLRQQLIVARGLILTLDYELYSAFASREVAERLNIDLYEYVQSEIEDIDELIFDQKYPNIYKNVTESEYEAELLSSGCTIAAFLRNHSDLNGDADGAIHKLIEIESIISKELSELDK